MAYALCMHMHVNAKTRWNVALDKGNCLPAARNVRPLHMQGRWEGGGSLGCVVWGRSGGLAPTTEH